MKVALAHDYLTLRGGAERVVLAMAAAFPGAPVHTSLYDPEGTFPEFADLDVRVSPLDRVPGLRRHHRAAMPLLPSAFARMHVDADVVLCSSSGWAHGVGTRGRTVVYCHTPAPWLYDPGMFLGQTAGPLTRAVRGLAAGPLTRWDRAAAARASSYLVNSTVVAERVRRCYGREAQVLHPPAAVRPGGERRPVPGIAPGFFLVVSRLFEYKNVAAVVQAVEQVEGARLVVVGRGPDEGRLRGLAGPATTFLTDVSDDQLRWLYDGCRALVAAADEDFGLTPLEAYAFGRPAVCWRRGGYLDSMSEGVSGVFFDAPTPASVADALRAAQERAWDPAAVRAWAERFSAARFAAGLQAAVAAAAQA